MNNPLSIFERAKAPHKRKKPFVHKQKPKKEKLITVHTSHEKPANLDFDHLDKLLESPDHLQKDSLKSEKEKERSNEQKDQKNGQIDQKQDQEDQKNGQKRQKQDQEDQKNGQKRQKQDQEDQTNGQKRQKIDQKHQTNQINQNRNQKEKTPDSNANSDPNLNPKNQEVPSVSSLPGLLVAGNIDQIPSGILQKYKSHSFPIPKSKAVLKEKALRYIDVIPKLLSGEEELSIFYTLAHAQKKNSANSTMSSQERWDLPWRQFVGGFYGLKRQSFVSALIHARYGQLIKKSRNKTILFWSSDMFCTYVLANEILLRMAMQDMNLSKLEAEVKLQETADFGCHLADSIELEDDLEFDEFELLAGSDHETS